MIDLIDAAIAAGWDRATTWLALRSLVDNLEDAERTLAETEAEIPRPLAGNDDDRHVCLPQRHGYTLSGYCRTCNAWRDIDPDAMPTDMVFIGRRFTCAECGSVREMILTPPRPDNRGR